MVRHQGFKIYVQDYAIGAATPGNFIAPLLFPLALSPVFPRLLALYKWQEESGLWVDPEECQEGPGYPWRVLPAPGNPCVAASFGWAPHPRGGGIIAGFVSEEKKRWRFISPNAEDAHHYKGAGFKAGEVLFTPPPADAIYL